ncbi:MAG: hypothetical protein K6G22_12960 [Lachnospiraceae bacterium]|nr:hypothetical protein [Lachnospiraceae bacterium]
MRWIISENCIVDEDISNTILKGKESFHVRPQCFKLLLALIEAKKNKKVLTFDNIGEILWQYDGGWDHGRRESLKKVIDGIKAVTGPGSIKGEYDTGLRLTCDVREISSSEKSRTDYYKKLWDNHYRGVVRDQVATGNVRELIDYFVVPHIADSKGETVSVPFAGNDYHRYIMAGSGFGKSTLLEMLLLCSIVDDMYETDESLLSANTRDKLAEYEQIRKALLGEDNKGLFPVFISADAANSRQYSDVLELAEGSDTEDYNTMINEACQAGDLLFLIDSIDELEADKIDHFLESLKALLERYKNTRVIFVSRFMGKKTVPFDHDILSIRELKTDDIKRIAESMLSPGEAEKVAARAEHDCYFKTLAKNPFMLITILETKGDRHIHHLLESIVNAIIDRRWDKHHYDISAEDIKLLLGFLACRFVFENRSSADLSEIRTCFIKAEDNLKLYGVSYDVPEKNIEYFLKTLSSQSGILSIINQNHVEKYLFQDDLVMCWLAANYIKKIISESDEIHDREGMGGIWANVYWLDRFLRQVSSKDYVLSADAVNVLAMTLAMCSEHSGQDIQNSILYFLICRDATSLNEEEKNNIASGFENIINNSFGENDITNIESSDSRKLINRILLARTSEPAR